MSTRPIVIGHLAEPSHSVRPVDARIDCGGFVAVPIFPGIAGPVGDETSHATDFAGCGVDGELEFGGSG